MLTRLGPTRPRPDWPHAGFHLGAKGGLDAGRL